MISRTMQYPGTTKHGVYSYTFNANNWVDNPALNCQVCTYVKRDRIAVHHFSVDKFDVRVDGVAAVGGAGDVRALTSQRL